MSLSAVVITHNEERNIARCLASLDFADEVIVVDAMSEDRTVDVARAHGARVVTRVWDGFARQKQYAVDRATGEWILLIDADEEVSSALAADIGRVVREKSAAVAYRVSRRNQFLGKWMDHGPWSVDRQIRLFRRERGSIAERPVHEGVEVDGPVDTLAGALNHYTHQTLSESFRRLNRYTTLEASERVGMRRIRLVDVVVPPFAVFLRYYVAKGCWREGVRGFLLAAVTAIYKSVLYLKILLLQHERTSHS